LKEGEGTKKTPRKKIKKIKKPLDKTANPGYNKGEDKDRR